MVFLYPLFLKGALPSLPVVHQLLVLVLGALVSTLLVCLSFFFTISFASFFFFTFFVFSFPFSFTAPFTGFFYLFPTFILWQKAAQE